MEVTPVPLVRHARATAAGAVMLVAALLSGSTVASARPDDDTAAPACGTDRSSLRYIVVFDEGTPQQAALDEIARACGDPVIYYPQIAVAVATSRYARFADRIGRDRALSAQQVTKTDKRKSDETGAEGADITGDPTGVPTADRTPDQWDMAMIKADQAHRVAEGSRDVVVGVLDSGVDPGHPDLRAALDPALSAGCLTGKPDTARTAWEPTASPHGTHVAGTIAAADDGRGITGVAPGVRIASIKVVDDDGYILPEYAVCGLMWAAANKMAVTNNSYFVDPWQLTCDRGAEHVAQEAVRRAVD